MNYGKMVKIIITTLVGILFTVILCTGNSIKRSDSVRAEVIPVDFGDFNDFDSGWDSDFGDFDDLDDLIWIGGSGCSGGGIKGIGSIVVIVIVVIILALRMSKRSGRSNHNRYRYDERGYTNTVHTNLGSGSRPWEKLPDRTGPIESVIKGHDPSFSSSDLITFAKNAFVDIQSAWSNRDLHPVIGILSTSLYSQTNIQLQLKIKDGIINKIENVTVNTAYLSSYTKDNEYEYVTLYLNAKMIDYQMNEHTGEIIRGDRTTRWDMYYRIKLMRAYGVKSRQALDGADEHKCPNCGSNLALSASGICEYCGSFITSGMYSWVIADIGTIRQDTVDEGINY